MQIRNVCVLGGTGFVGRHVVRRLAERGIQVRVPTRRRERSKELLVLPTTHRAEVTASDPPDVVAVSVGDGCTIAGIWKGMKEMHLLGVLPRLPRLLGVSLGRDGADHPGPGER